MANFRVHGCSNIDHGARSGFVCIYFKPKGYWSDVIEVHVRRDYTAKDVPLKECRTVWQTSIKVASGGRDTDAVPCDIEATGYFMEALAFARTFADTVNYGELERAYREERDRRREEFSKEWAAVGVQT